MRNKSEDNSIEQEFKKTKRELRRLFGKRKREFRFDKIQNQLRQKKIFDKKNIVKNYGSHRHFVTPSIPKAIRFSVTLTTIIDVKILTQCIYDVAPRFPYLLLSVKRGVFAYRLEETHLVPILNVDNLIPASEIAYQDGCHLFRISYYMSRISIDVNLQLVDHNMVRDFILVLTNRYFCLRNLSQFNYPIHYRDYYTYDEMFQPHMLVPEISATTVKLSTKGTDANLPRKLMKFETEFIPSLEILELDTTIEEIATANNCSLRALVAGFLINAIYRGNERRGSKKVAPVKVAIICDLRDTFPTSSLRSFVTSVSYKTCSSEALDAAHILDERISTDTAINANRANLANSSALRSIVPTHISERFKLEKFSATVYDMGSIDVSSDLINRTEFVVGTSPECPISCGIVRYNDKIILSLNSNLASPNILKVFTDNLVSCGIRVHLTTNRRNNLV